MANKMIRAINAGIGLLNPKSWGPFVEAYDRTKFNHGFSVSWSQGGEDLALAGLFPVSYRGNYVDVGAHHPSRFSVTRHLYQNGWSGVNVEANPDLIAAFLAQRPRDKNLWACVGTESKYSLNVFEEPAISTVNDAWKERFLLENQKISKVVDIPGISLLTILKENFPESSIDLLCIDAEGSDLNVLQSGFFEKNSQYKPRWLVLESTPPIEDSLKTPAVAYAISLGYKPHMVLSMSTILRLES